MSYTLLCRRHHFKHRCALVVRDAPHAMELLRKLLAKEKLPNSFISTVPVDFAEQPMLVEYADTLLGTLKSDTPRYGESLRTLADLYCQGYRLQWHKLFGATTPRRIPLPGYPFANRSYWIEALPAVTHSQTIPIDKPRGIALTSLDADPPASAAPAAPVGDIASELAESLAEALLIPMAEIDTALSFVELGMDSVTGAQWSQTLNRRFGTSLTIAKLYQYPSIPELAAFQSDATRAVTCAN
jgi:acyl transferase domain-containing protein